MVKVIHHIVSAEVHRLARELLDPEPEKKRGKAVFPGKQGREGDQGKKKLSSLRKAMEANQMCISHLFRRFCEDRWF